MVLCIGCQEAEATDHRRCGQSYCARCTKVIGPDCCKFDLRNIALQGNLLRVSDYEARYDSISSRATAVELVVVDKLSKFDAETEHQIEQLKAQRARLRERAAASDMRLLDTLGVELKELIGLMTLAETAEQLEQEGKSVPGITDAMAKRIYRLSELCLGKLGRKQIDPLLGVRIMAHNNGDFGLLRDGQVAVYTPPRPQEEHGGAAKSGCPIVPFDPAVWKDCTDGCMVCGIGHQVMGFTVGRTMVILDNETGGYYESRVSRKIAFMRDLVLKELLGEPHARDERFFPNEQVLRIDDYLYKVLAPEPVFILNDLEVDVQVMGRCAGVTNPVYHNVIAWIDDIEYNLCIPR